MVKSQNVHVQQSIPSASLMDILPGKNELYGTKEYWYGFAVFIRVNV
jgi:hypothetical protein